MSGDIFVISDTHFGHENVLKFGNRPWDTVEEMEEGLVSLWNTTVGKGDVVLILGDFAWRGQDWKVADRLNGFKRLIMGNHDKGNLGTLCNHFQAVHGVYAKKNMVFTHIPIIFGEGRSWEVNVHGHIHSADQNIDDPRYYNVNMDATGIYSPVPLEDIERDLRQRRMEVMLAE